MMDGAMETKRTLRDDVSLVLAGEAGQGIQTIEHMLTRVLHAGGYNVFATKEVMSRVRGGCNSSEIRVTARPAGAFVDRIDVLVPLDPEAFPHLGDRVTPQTALLGERERFPDRDTMLDVPFTRIGKEAGNALFANTAAVGTLLGVMDVPFAGLEAFLPRHFKGKDPAVVEGNVRAGRAGYARGRALAEDGALRIAVAPAADRDALCFLSGADAVGLGALAGGCNVVSSYPMSPSTAVLTFMARHAARCKTVVEQAEDEIAAVNMALGAWYAGARAMVTTSGGGFALMTEGMSLAGMIESPLVVHLAQRPGPATGLPTRTEQGDLDLALYAGHGEFPRVLLAPGSAEQAFALSRRAFELADRFQVPVVILTDAFLMDSMFRVPPPDVDTATEAPCIVETGAGYARYRLTPDGLSQRGVPGYGAGLVCVDSDEHDEAGRITEDAGMRTRMVDKRLARFDALVGAAVAPARIGPEDAPTLLVGWGTTYHPVREALLRAGRDDIAFLHFPQVYPLPCGTAKLLRSARRLVGIENNATGQFARLIRRETGIAMHRSIRKYNGFPFSVEDIEQALETLNPSPSSPNPPAAATNIE
jgi:2-oxoglutarate/2-oxoacid ferredoxin oxidoreductase subunit alpha